MSATDVPGNGDDLQHLKSHLLKQLERVGDKELEALARSCAGESGPNPSEYRSMEWCGRSVTKELLEFPDGRVFLGRCIEAEQKRRVLVGAETNLGARGRKLTDFLRRWGKIGPAQVKG